jgi:subtilisin
LRRPVTLFMAVALLLSLAAPAAAGDPDVSAPPVSPPPEASPSAEPSLSPEPSLTPEPSLSSDPTQAPEPTATIDEPAATLTAPEPDLSPSPPGTRPASAERRDSADPTGRWIVVYKKGTDVGTTARRQATKIGFATERTFSHTIRGFSAALDPRQVRLLRNDPSVAAIVPDERIALAAQSYPTGINRVGTRISAVAKIDGLDGRVDADVAIVDTGISKIVADLNVAGGYNCSTTDRTAWRDVHGHGTHVAGTVGAIDNASGVVGVAPGVRLWAVKILNDSGSGLLSWYVCGLDWIAAQRDPADAARPKFESVNMSVAKSGKDDAACGSKNADILHAAICRLVASGVTVVAAAANDSANAAGRVPAAYNEVITVSALADTDGKPGGLGGHRCYSWGSYDADDTFANFSNYGSDIDLIAPGKCIWSTVPGGYAYMSGTSMAAPHVAGAVALLKASRPQLKPAEVREALQYLGNSNWKTTTDPDSIHEKLLDVSRIGSRGDFSIAAGFTRTVAEAGGKAVFAITLTRTATSFERITIGVSGLPAGLTAAFSAASVYGFGTQSTTMSVVVPKGTPSGSYTLTVTGSEHGKTHQATATIVVTNDLPTATAPRIDAWPRGTLGATTVPARVSWWAASDPSSAIAGYEVQASVDGGAWSTPTALGPAVHSLSRSQMLGHTYQYRVRARDAVGNWSAWAPGATTTGSLLQETSPSIAYKGTWARHTYANASGGTERYATATGASAKVTFTGRAAALVAPIGPARGSAGIYVDGVYRTTVNFRASAGKSRQMMYSTTFSSLGTHSVEVRLSGNGRVDVDAFVIFR